VDASFIRQQTLFGAIVGEQASLHHLILHLFIFFSNIQPLLPRKPLCFVFVFLFCCLDGVRQPPYGRTEEIVTGLL
jgi:hypothetical protein